VAYSLVYKTRYLFLVCLFKLVYKRAKFSVFLTQAPQSAAAGLPDPAAPRGQCVTRPLLTRLFMTGGGDLKPPGGA